MFQLLLSTFASVFTKETFSSIGNALLSWQVRANFKRAIRDIVEDEIEEALRLNGVDSETIQKYLRKHRDDIRKEITNRFEALLMR
jgi:hypothetical protein